MGKRGYNAKARQNPQTIVDNSALKNIKLELNDVDASCGAGYDEANALVLPSKKRQTKIKLERTQNVRILTKKQRKNLQTIVNKKKKKEGRAELLEKLAEVQIPAAELQQYTSISQVQTVGVKKLPMLEQLLAKKHKNRQQQATATTAASSGKMSSIKGAAKRKLMIEEQEDLKAKRKNPNIVSLECDSDSDSDNDNDDEDEIDETEIASAAAVETAAVVEVKKPTEATNKAPAALPMHSTVYVPVHRTAEVQAARLKLPILAEEQEIMEVINENSIVIIAGETGSGKTTQIPQFLYEAGYAQHGKLIGITEPRRVAAIAMSKRVAHEMNLSAREVSYLIRFEGNVTADTRIKFMTDGVLLKEIETDFMLNKYSVIVLDEAHERSAYTDILIGLLSRIVPMRLKTNPEHPLKLLIMSATLRVEDFTSNARLFKSPPPLLQVQARQFPVSIHFQKRTPDNYLEDAFRKTVRIHAQLPEGGILVFLTGQQEVNHLVRKLRRAFPYKPKKQSASKVETAATKEETQDDYAAAADLELDMVHAIRSVKKSKKKFAAQMCLPKIDLDDFKLPTDDTEADLHETADMENSDDEFSLLPEEADDLADEEQEENGALQVTSTAESIAATKQPLWVLPLYSLLSTQKQNRIFQAAPAGCRLCVVSTNVAETSLTIPGIKYVVDSGRQKTRLYDKITGVSAFVVTFSSKASADQRAGRAGRVSAGHCYRLYSSAVFMHDFEDFSMPDIQKKPVDDLMLQMRCMGIDRVINFPFPSPPDAVQLQAAEQRLIHLGALEHQPNANSIKPLPPMLTQLGKVIAHFPVSPRFGKMLALSHQQNLLAYTVCLVAALSVQEVLQEVHYDRAEEAAQMAFNMQKLQKRRLSWAKGGHFELLGDAMVLLRAVGAAEYAGSKGDLTQFCQQNGLRHKAITEVRKIRKQLTDEINLNMSDVNLLLDPNMPPPTDAQARFLRQILLAGMVDQVARKVSLADIADKEEKRRLKYAYNCMNMQEPAFMHSSSVLKQRKQLPEWIIYQEAYELQHGDSNKMFIRGITVIEPEWLLLYAPLQCNIRTIREEPAPRYKTEDGKIYCFADATFGKAGWELPLTEIEMPAGDKACSYFGMFLLNGQVCEKLADFKDKLKVAPTALIKSWSNLNENVLCFKRALISHNINSRQKLFAFWQEQPNFLMTEYHYLLYNVAVTDLLMIWPPMPKS